MSTEHTAENGLRLRLLNAVVRAVSQDDPTGHLPNCGYADDAPECGCADFGRRVWDAITNVEIDRLRSTGGNRFIPADGTRADLMRTINDQLGDLQEWADWTDRVFDLAEVTISTKRIPSGLISVSVTADLACVTPPADSEATR